MAILAGTALAMQAAPLWAYEISDRFAIDTVIEVEAFDTDDVGGDFSGQDGRDIELSTVEVHLDARPIERLSAHVVFLYEEPEGDEPVLDEGTVSLSLSGSLGLTAGKEYVPFGRFDTLVVTDPLTLELAETNETAVQLDFQFGGWSGATYVYSGDTMDPADGDTREGYGAALEYTAAAWVVGGNLISNLGDSDTLQELDAGSVVGALQDDIPGLSLYATGAVGPVTLVAEHTRALDEFAVGDLGGTVASSSQPSATNLEFGFAFAEHWAIAAAWRHTDEARFAGLPETMVAAALSYTINEYATVALEVNHKEDYGVSEGGTGEDSRTVLTQLAVEF